MSERDVKGHKLTGEISSRIRSGEIPEEALNAKRIPVDNSPDPKLVKGAHGEGLGDTTRSDPSAATRDE